MKYVTGFLHFNLEIFCQQILFYDSTRSLAGIFEHAHARMFIARACERQRHQCIYLRMPMKNIWNIYAIGYYLCLRGEYRQSIKVHIFARIWTDTSESQLLEEKITNALSMVECSPSM